MLSNGARVTLCSGEEGIFGGMCKVCTLLMEEYECYEVFLMRVVMIFEEKLAC